jgi:hypothetical protein
MKYILKKDFLLMGLLVLVLAVPAQVKTQAAESEIETRATFPVAADRAPIRTLKVFATAYSSDPYQTDATPCIPAMNFDLCKNFEEHGLEDTIAANFLPLGTQVRFPEVYVGKIFVVRDRMNSRYNYDRIGYYRIDFYKAKANATGTLDRKASKQEAIQFGFKRDIKMEVIGV